MQQLFPLQAWVNHKVGHDFMKNGFRDFSPGSTSMIKINLSAFEFMQQNIKTDIFRTKNIDRIRVDLCRKGHRIIS